MEKRLPHKFTYKKRESDFLKRYHTNSTRMKRKHTWSSQYEISINKQCYKKSTVRLLNHSIKRTEPRIINNCAGADQFFRFYELFGNLYVNKKLTTVKSGVWIWRLFLATAIEMHCVCLSFGPFSLILYFYLKHEV